MSTINLDAIRKRIDQLNGKRGAFSDVKLWKPGEGEHTVRVLPWKETKDGMPFIERLVYFAFGGKIVSPRSFGKPDPIDDFIRKLYDEARDGKDASKVLANAIRPKLMTCAAVVDRNDEAAGPQLWSMNALVAKDVLNLFLNKQVGNFIDLETGRDLVVTLSPSPKKFNGRTVFDTKIMPSFEKSPAGDKTNITKWTENLPNIDEFYRLLPHDEIKQQFEEWLRTGGPDKVTLGGAGASSQVTSQLDAVAAAVRDGKDAKKISKPASKKVESVQDAIDTMLKDIEPTESSDD
jgi:hypothetical protein